MEIHNFLTTFSYYLKFNLTGLTLVDRSLILWLFFRWPVDQSFVFDQTTIPNGKSTKLPLFDDFWLQLTINFDHRYQAKNVIFPIFSQFLSSFHKKEIRNFSSFRQGKRSHYFPPTTLFVSPPFLSQNGIGHQCDFPLNDMLGYFPTRLYFNCHNPS